ncbi:hypothetical protein [Marinobacterium aestuarii]|uniref:hypothetical protein n=1 Tax=Marinobacterium aestuarii TaxID=1821621 RepID=UPI000A918883|nr:hypothetical protein [Marinobacterium aestuarii]
MSSEKKEAISLASIMSIAFAVVLSFDTLVFNKVPIILMLWGLVAGLVIGHQEVRSFWVNYKLAILPSLILCISPPIAALFRALLAVAAGVVPNVQSFFGYSIFNPGWLQYKPFLVLAVVVCAYIITSIILTVGSMASGLLLRYLSSAYAAGPAAFERVEKIAKRVISILTILGIFALLS